jgi:hypothetical protein
VGAGEVFLVTGETATSKATMNRNEIKSGPVRSESQAKQGGRSPLTLWVLCGSLVLAAIVAYFLLTQANVIAPNRPNAVVNPANPTAPASDQKPNQ